MRASLTPFPPLWALNSNAFNYQTRLTSYFFVLPFWGGGRLENAGDNSTCVLTILGEIK